MKDAMFCPREIKYIQFMDLSSFSKKLLLVLDFTMLPHTASNKRTFFFLVKDSVSVVQPCIYAGLTMCPIIHKWLAWWKV